MRYVLDYLGWFSTVLKVFLIFTICFSLKFCEFLTFIFSDRQLSFQLYKIHSSFIHPADIQWFSDTRHTGHNANVGYLLVNKDFLLGFYFPRASLALQLLSHWATELSYDLSVLVRGQNMLIVPGFFVVETRFLVWFLFSPKSGSLSHDAHGAAYGFWFCHPHCLVILTANEELDLQIKTAWRLDISVGGFLSLVWVCT